MVDLNRLTPQEVEELFILKEKIFGDFKFAVVDFTDPDCRRYNNLMLKTFGNEHLMEE